MLLMVTLLRNPDRGLWTEYSTLQPATYRALALAPGGDLTITPSLSRLRQVLFSPHQRPEC